MNATINAQNGSLQDEYIDKKEVARRLNKDPRTITTWMKRGLLPYCKAGRTVLFNWPVVRDSLNTRMQAVH